MVRNLSIPPPQDANMDTTVPPPPLSGVDVTQPVQMPPSSAANPTGDDEDDDFDVDATTQLGPTGLQPGAQLP